MSYTCSCGWEFVGKDDTEELLARIEHLREEHFTGPDREFEGDNFQLIAAVHDALHLIETDDLGGWYASQVSRMRDDACEIMGYESDNHPRTSTAVAHNDD